MKGFLIMFAILAFISIWIYAIGYSVNKCGPSALFMGKTGVALAASGACDK